MPESSHDRRVRSDSNKKIDLSLKLKSVFLIVILGIVSLFVSINLVAYGIMKQKKFNSEEKIVEALNLAFKRGWLSAIRKFDENIGVNKVSVLEQRFIEARMEFAVDMKKIYNLDVLETGEKINIEIEGLIDEPGTLSNY